ncbi:uncharacterized protein JCM10292_004059 [Rhodotorula paludigena]|uniref:uncharacterized protein n=1 Tax=Rhodotorula paludigena TaxID=86838 RepID=UPI00317C7DA6
MFGALRSLFRAAHDRPPSPETASTPLPTDPKTAAPDPLAPHAGPSEAASSSSQAAQNQAGPSRRHGSAPPTVFRPEYSDECEDILDSSSAYESSSLHDDDDDDSDSNNAPATIDPRMLRRAPPPDDAPLPRRKTPSPSVSLHGDDSSPAAPRPLADMKDDDDDEYVDDDDDDVDTDMAGDSDEGGLASDDLPAPSSLATRSRRRGAASASTSEPARRRRSDRRASASASTPRPAQAGPASRTRTSALRRAARSQTPEASPSAGTRAGKRARAGEEAAEGKSKGKRKGKRKGKAREVSPERVAQDESEDDLASEPEPAAPPKKKQRRRESTAGSDGLPQPPSKPKKKGKERQHESAGTLVRGKIGEENLSPMWRKIVDDDELSQSFKRFRLAPAPEDEDEAPVADEPIYQGDVLEIQGDEGGRGWYACVEDIRAPRAQIGEDFTVTSVALLVSWFYSAADLRERKGDNDHAWMSQSENLGPNERVKTDERQWIMQDMVISRRREIMYVFDDAYPAPSPRPSRDPPNAPRHPLSFFRPAALVPLAPTSYALPALQSPSKRSARKAAAAAGVGGSSEVPPYLFGVSALPDSRLRAGGAPPDEPVPKKKRGEDGVRGVPYVRVAFTFNEQEDREEEEELVRDGYGTPGGSGTAGSGGTKGKGKGKKKRKKIRPLTFTPHSTHGTPYDPRVVQHYSRDTQTWHNVTDLLAGKHYRTEPTVEALKPVSALKHGADGGDADKRRKSVIFELDFPPSRTPSRSNASPNSTATPRANGSTASARSAASTSPTTLASDSIAGGSSPSLSQELSALANSHIVRGGAYGLTGNAYLVTRAASLVPLLASPASGPEAADEARALLKSASAWSAEVERRARNHAEGNRLATCWRSKGTEGLRQVEEELKGVKAAWVCPVSGKDI